MINSRKIIYNPYANSSRPAKLDEKRLQYLIKRLQLALSNYQKKQKEVIAKQFTREVLVYVLENELIKEFENIKDFVDRLEIEFPCD